jgi:hypothetical protein
MKTSITHKSKPQSSNPISVGLSCWLWERERVRRIVRLGEKWGVNLKLTQHIHGLRRDIRCQITGPNVDRFIGEFARRC